MIRRNAHYFQHVPFEQPAGITPWLKARGCLVGSTCFYKSWEPPQLEDIDLLIVMGGPMGVNDEAEYPWLSAEKRLIETAITAGKQVLGICLGAQLVASVCGAGVTANRQKEIGWYPVKASDLTQPLLEGLPAELNAFHWHGDTFTLPAGAVHLFSSPGCFNQGFLLERRVLGLQFHLELDFAAILGLIENCRGELQPAKYIQSEAEILAASPENIPAARGALERMLSNFFKL